MSRIKSCLTSRYAAFALALLTAVPALADDTEIFRSQAETSGAHPNVLFVMDTSGSMATLVTSPRPPYDPNHDYSNVGSCNSSNLYYVAAAAVPSTPPKCGGSSPATSVGMSTNNCAALAAAFAAGAGYYQDVAAQFRGTSPNKRWNTLANGNSGAVECKTDDGVHGQYSNSPDTVKYIQENNSNPWTATTGSAWGQSGGGTAPYNTSTSYVFYAANWLNWANMPASAYEQTRIDIIKQVATDLSGSLNNVNIGLMRYNPDVSGNAEGGSVIQAIGDISTNRAGFQSAVSGLSANGHTPLTETLYEAQQYLAGRAVDYGNGQIKSVAASRTGGSSTSNTYQTPIQYQCQKNYVVYLTDGLPTTDTSANTKVSNLPGFTYRTGSSCGTPPGSTSDGGQCMDDLAAHMNTKDLSPLPGLQTAQTYMIGFGNDPDLATTGTPYLNAVADAGGTGAAHTAEDADSLTATLQQIFSDIQETSASFITPAVSVNAFNRTQTQGDLYFSVFKASLGLHWPGNLKKYRLIAGNPDRIVDSNNVSAVDTNGFFANGTTSFWSAAADGSDVTRGGALENIPQPASRNIYTNITSNRLLTDAGNALLTTNGNLTDAVLNTGGTNPTRDTVIDYTRGYDVNDANGDGSRTDPGPQIMGDPLHGKPALVTYGGTTGSPDVNDTVVFVPTNDGMLHAIAAKNGSGGGRELWSFVPQQLLYRLVDLYQNADTATRSYGLDGDVQVLKYDVNQDGVVDASAGDFVWLFFGMRMGHDSTGNSYYFALDVTDRNSPKMLWVDGSTQLPGLGQTWSTPTIARVNVGPNGAANTNAQKLVLIFGGGYDMAAESPTNRTESSGNRVFMVDAETGALLWSAGPSGADLNLVKMTNAIPSAITVIDTDGDRFADRMYAADLGGRIWRFDIFNGNTASTLVTGGAIAQLGAGSVSPAVAQVDNRRFYSSPDVTPVQTRGASPFFNIAIGSGYRGHPLDSTTTDRFYSVRDKQPYAHLTQANYNAIVPILDGNLVDITANPAGTAVPASQPGWKLSMTRNGAGEKVLAESTTVNNVILFTSFQPQSAAAGDPCFPANINRAYAVSLYTGKPSLDFNDDGVVDVNDLSITLGQTGIVGGVNVSFLNDGTHVDPNDPNSPLNPAKTACQFGSQLLKCPQVGNTVRTFWRRRDAQ